MKIKPLADRIVLKLIPSEEKTASGIVLPDSAKENRKKGKLSRLAPAEGWKMARDYQAK